MIIEKQQSLEEKDKKYVLHAMSSYNSAKSPLIVKKAEGVWLTDINDKKYLDGKSGLFCVNAGYGRKELVDAASEQLATMPYYPMTESHMPAIKLAEKLNDWLEDDYVIFFSNSGSEANETAFKIARQYHHIAGESARYKFISRYRGYHGSSGAALAATGQAQRKYMYEPLSPGFLHVSAPDSYRCPDYLSIEEYGLKCAREIEKKMEWELSETIAGVIVEPIITGGGVLIPPENYLKEVRDVCDRHGALLIVDEVICGFGRTGKPFGYMNYGIKPDIVTMAKGLTSAYLPLSATAVRRELIDKIKNKEKYDNFRHINTFGGNPAACALALKNLEIILNEGLIERSAQVGKWMLQELEELTSHPNVGDIRGKGLILGIELVKDKQTKEPVQDAKINKIISICKEKGLLIGKNGNTVAGYNNIISFGPPLCVADTEASFIIDTIKEAFDTII